MDVDPPADLLIEIDLTNEAARLASPGAEADPIVGSLIQLISG